MAYSSPATVVTATTITSAWGNSVKSATDFLANPPACKAYKSTGHSVPTATDTALTWDTEAFDTDNMHSLVTNTDRLTMNTAGLYVVTLQIQFPFDAGGGERMGSLYLNNTTLIARDRRLSHSVGVGTTNMTLTTLYKFAAGDWVQPTAYQASGTTMTVTQGIGSTSISAVWVGLG
jgi:hypothetical protein